MVIPFADVPWPAVGIAVFTVLLGPLLIWWVQGRRAARLDKANRAHLKEMLSGERYQLRSLKTLTRATGTSDEECRRLLREIGAVGRTLKGDREGWKLPDEPVVPAERPPSP